MIIPLSLELAGITISPTQSQIQWDGFPIADILILPSFFVTLFVAWLAVRSNRITAEASSLAYLPILSLKWESDERNIFGAKATMHNMGQGAAFNIEIERFVMDVTGADIFGIPLSGVWEVQLVSPVDVLAPGESVVLRIDGYEDEQKTEGNSLKAFLMSHGKDLVKLPIRFNDAASHPYISIIGVGSGEARILVPARKFTPLRWLKYMWQFRVQSWHRIRKYRKKSSMANKKNL
jgi:hypothetical protein